MNDDIETRVVRLEKDVVRLRRALREAFRALYDPKEIEVLDAGVGSRRWSVRAKRAIERLGVKTIGELASKTEADILSVKNCGQTTLNEIAKNLAELGLPPLRSSHREEPA